MTDLCYGETMSQHPEPEDIAAYLSHGLPQPNRATLEAHLASCRLCRQEVISARRLLESGLRRSRWPMIVPAAAAAVLAIALIGRGVLTPPVDRETVRGPGAANETEMAASISAISPADEGTIAGSEVLFAWAAQQGRPLYRLTLTDGSGKALWVRDTPDTTLTLPAGITLSPGRTYFWYVDALDSSGRSLTTGTHRFSMAQ